MMLALLHNNKRASARLVMEMYVSVKEVVGQMRLNVGAID
jgi:hypothetical protein